MDPAVRYRQPGPSLQAVEAALARFVAWLGRAGCSGYDQYDLWATRYGIWSRRVYYRYGKPAAPLVLPLALADWLAPGSRQWFCPRRRYPSADAHYLLGFLALHQARGRAADLDAAGTFAEALIQSAIPGFAGPCWGYPFDWQAIDGLCRRNTPLITATPYAFDALLDLYEATGSERYRTAARGVAEFIATDIHDTPSGRGQAASYTPFDQSKVVNASAYRAACLARASVAFDLRDYRRLAAGNARFVVDQQQADGSWPYAVDGQTFVDHMHTCFVLKGLYRTYQVLRDEELLAAVRRGYRYYRQHLFYGNGLPRPFARGGSTQFRVAELYDYAEALNLALLLQPDLDTLELAGRLARSLVDDWQTPAGYLITRVSRGGIRNRVPYPRWGQAPAFHALALYYRDAVAIMPARPAVADREAAIG